MSYDIANEIANQLTLSRNGFGVLKMFIGAKNIGFFGSSENIIGGLQFRFPGSKAANCVRIELTPLDVYCVRFYKIRGLDSKEVKTFDEVYCDNLKEIFENFTKLYLSFR